MGHLFSGFTTSENIKIQNAAIEAQKAVEKAWKDIQSIKKSGSTSFQYMKWFGMYDTKRVQTVYEKINAIHYAMTASSIKCVKSGAAGHYAAAFQPDKGWNMHKVKDIVKSGGYRVEYTNLFFGNVSKDDGGNHPQTLTFIHELSHVVAATDDEPFPPDPSEDCYGQKKCRLIAEKYPGVAVTNADSYGFYCTEFV